VLVVAFKRTLFYKQDEDIQLAQKPIRKKFKTKPILQRTLNVNDDGFEVIFALASEYDSGIQAYWFEKMPGVEYLRLLSL
jgi:hypothetical protein